MLSPHPGRVKAELDVEHLGFADLGTPAFEQLHRRIHELLFADKVETALATEIAPWLTSRCAPLPPPRRPERVIALDAIGAVGDAARPLSPFERLLPTSPRCAG